MIPRRRLLVPLLAALAAGTGAARAQGAAVRLPWRHLDERLTLGMNPNFVQFRSEPDEAPKVEVSEEERTLITLLRERPDNPSAQVRLGEIELRKGNRTRASERFLSVARADGGNREALSGLAACLLADNSIDPAIKLLEEMRRKSLLTPLDRANLAYAYFRRDRQDDATRTLVDLLEELERQPATPAANKAACAFNLAGLALAQNRSTDATAWLRKVKEWESK